MKIPFTTEQFFEVIEKYNVILFPAQIVLLILGILSVVFIHSRSKSKNKFIGVFLGVLWIWTGLAYHLAYFTSINKAAYVFGVLFLLQGVLFIIATFTTRLEFSFRKSWPRIIGYFFILFGLIIYPILLYAMHQEITTTITLGLPCPSTILTFGFLLLTSRKFPKYLLVIPSIWAIIGTSAAINFGVYPDFLMIFAAVFADIYLILRKNRTRV